MRLSRDNSELYLKQMRFSIHTGPLADEISFGLAMARSARQREPRD
jgi:hypothetical protein